MLWYHYLGLICGGLVGLFVLWIGLQVLFAYLRYRRSPEKLWRDQILRLHAQAQQQLQAERRSLISSGAADPAEEKALRDRAFDQFLGSIAVEELDAYLGIGPATIAKLREAGYESLEKLNRGPVRVAGLGGKRLADVEGAVRDLVKQAGSRFQAGACPQARSLLDQLEALRASHSEQGLRARTRVQAMQALITQLRPLVEFSSHLAFLRTALEHQDGLPGYDVLGLELPNLETALALADAEAQAAFAAKPRRPSATEETAVPEAKVAPPARLIEAPSHRASGDLFRDALGSAPAAPARPQEAERVLQAQPEPARDRQAPPPGQTRESQLAILEIDSAAPLSADLVRRQYNLLSERYAEEKFVTAGPEFVALAKRKREAVLAAATALLQSFGEAVEVAPATAAAPQELRHNPDLDALFGD